MSLPWNKAVRVHVGARSVQGVLHPAWAPRKTLSEARHSIDSTVGAAVTAVLTELSNHGRARLGQVFMSDARTHFDVVPGDYADLGERQLDSIAQVCVSEILGDSAAGLRVRWQLQRGDQHLLIAAMDGGEVDQVLQAMSEAGLQSVSVQPNFCGRWNGHHTTLPSGHGVVASIDDGHVVAALLVQGAIAALSCGPLQGAQASAMTLSEALDVRVNRLLASVGQDPSALTGCVLLGTGARAQGLSARWQVSTGVGVQR